MYSSQPDDTGMTMSEAGLAELVASLALKSATFRASLVQAVARRADTTLVFLDMSKEMQAAALKRILAHEPNIDIEHRMP